MPDPKRTCSVQMRQELAGAAKPQCVNRLRYRALSERQAANLQVIRYATDAYNALLTDLRVASIEMIEGDRPVDVDSNIPAFTQANVWHGQACDRLVAQIVSSANLGCFD